MNKDIDELLAQLQQDKSLKVWSLIITFFGDVVLARGGNISAKTIQNVLAAMGIGAGAVRTALSRLAADRWIERHKTGRESYYRLDADGYEPFKRAAARIYAPVILCNGNTADKSDDWQIVISKPGAGLEKLSDNGIQLAANCRLYFESDKSTLQSGDTLVVCGELQQIPSWLTESIMPDSVKLGYPALVSRFAVFDQVEKLSPLDSLVLRCLLIHEWRRLLMRTPALPEVLQTEDWPEVVCRNFVAQLYQQLVASSELWLDEHATCITGSLPRSTDVVANRFTPHFETT